MPVVRPNITVRRAWQSSADHLIVAKKDKIHLSRQLPSTRLYLLKVHWVMNSSMD
jgi:hypothetical protein